MNGLKKIFKIDGTNRWVRYRINEFTSNHGAILFDESKEGNIPNSNIYRVGFNDFGHIDIYVDKDFKLINSICMVYLKSEILLQMDEINFPDNDNYEIPFFDTSIWDNDDDDDGLWQMIDSQHPIEVYHNGIDVVHIIFGANHKTIPLSEEIQFQYDQESALTGFLLKGSEVTELIERLKND